MCNVHPAKRVKSTTYLRNHDKDENKLKEVEKSTFEKQLKEKLDLLTRISN